MGSSTIRAIWATTLLIATLAAGAAGQQSAKFGEYIAAGRQAMQAGQLKKAERFFKSATVEAQSINSPQTGKAYRWLAAVYEREGHNDRALAAAQQALVADEKSLGPKSLPVIMDLDSLGTLYLLQGRRMSIDEKSTAAENCWLRATQFGENLPNPKPVLPALERLTALYTRQHEFEKSKVLLTSAAKSLQQSPRSNVLQVAIVQSLLASVYRSEGDVREAARIEHLAGASLRAGASPAAYDAYLRFQKLEQERSPASYARIDNGLLQLGGSARSSAATRAPPDEPCEDALCQAENPGWQTTGQLSAGP